MAENPVRNKVEYGLKNVYYSMVSLVDGVAVYGTPKHIPGAVSLALPPQGEMVKFEADNIDYYVSLDNRGYAGTIGFALIPDEFKVDALGETHDELTGVQTEHADAKINAFALMFQFEGDKKAIRHVLYNCYAGRSEMASGTNRGATPNTNTLNIEALPRETDNVVKRKTTEKTTETVYNSWLTEVFNPEIPEV